MEMIVERWKGARHSEISKKPWWWFRTLDEAKEIPEEPFAIEYLKVESGETFTHTFGTVYWQEGKLNVELLRESGITMWRIRPDIEARIAFDFGIPVR